MKCNYCLKDFIHNTLNRKYCSQECKKLKKKEIRNKWYQNNKDKVREIGKAYREKNKEKYRKCARDFYHKVRKFDDQYKEDRKVYMREYRKRNAEKFRILAKKNVSLWRARKKDYQEIIKQFPMTWEEYKESDRWHQIKT